MSDPQRIPLNDLRRQLAEERDDIRAAIDRVLDSGWYVLGPECHAFESELAQFNGVSHAIGVASGTDALELSISSVTKPGATILTAANCGGYTTTAARAAGRGVAYADVDAETHLLTPATIEAHLGEVDAVVLTHLYGRAALVEEIADLCSTAGIALIEDCAQAIGAISPGGNRVGSVGDVAAFSFYPTKNLGALGDGGAVLTSSDEVNARVRRLRQYGWGSKYAVETAGGINSRLDELQAAILRERLHSIDIKNCRRREIVASYMRAAATSGFKSPFVDDISHVAHLAIFEVDDRDRVRRLFASEGIATDIHYPVPDHLQVAWRGQHPPSLPVTESLAKRIMTLPTFPEIREDEVQRICDVLHATSNQHS